METITDTQLINDQLADWYLNSRDQLMSSSGEVLNSFRPAAMESFRRLGIPDRSPANYKFTDVQHDAWFRHNASINVLFNDGHVESGYKMPTLPKPYSGTESKEFYVN